MTDATLKFPIKPLQPGAFSNLDIAALAAAQPVAGQPVGAILGDCKGGAPNTPLLITSLQIAKSVLRSGPLYDAARAFFAAGGAQFWAVRIGNGIAPSTATLAGATGTPIVLTARDFGVWTNSIQQGVAANNKLTFSYTDLFGVRYTETFACGAAATAQQVVDAINGLNPAFAKSSYFGAAATGTGTMPLAVVASAAAASGADTGTLTSTDWANGLAALESKQLDMIVVATTDATIHALVQAHCVAMSTTLARRERTCVHGPAIGENDAAYVVRAGNLLSNRSQLVVPPVSLNDDLGNTVLYPGYVAAAGTMGEHCALPDQATSLTHKRAAWIVGVERELSTMPASSLDVLLGAGCTPLAPAEGGGIWYVDSLSTNLTVPLLADFHKIRTADEVSKRMRRRLEAKFVGPKTLDGTAQEIALEAKAELTLQLGQTLIRGFGTIKVQEDPQDPRAYLVSIQVILPDTTKFVLITVALMPPNATTATA